MSEPTPHDPTAKRQEICVYLGIGSNIDAAQNILAAKARLREAFAGAAYSAVFESEAVGFTGDNFLNLVARIDTALSLAALVAAIKGIEIELGRQHQAVKYSSRTIDIDILIYGARVCDQPIQLPRAEILENAYVLKPLAEMAPEMTHPGGDLCYRELWARFDQSRQKLWRRQLTPAAG